MNTKQCGACMKYKELDEFHNKNRRKVRKDGSVHEWSGKQAFCKACTNSKRKATPKQKARNNKEVVQATTKKFYINLRLDWVDLIKEHKELKCEKCGYDKTWAGLDFHHTDAREKENTISTLMKSKPTKDRMVEMKSELDKCIILCATCHREEHMKYNWLNGDKIRKKYSSIL